MHSSTQVAHYLHRDLAKVLGLPTQRVRVIQPTVGGAFGGKEDMSNQGQTALAAWLLQRPVKCTLSREESLLMHAKRHPIRMEYWVGCDENGRLTAVKSFTESYGSFAYSVGLTTWLLEAMSSV